MGKSKSQKTKDVGIAGLNSQNAIKSSTEKKQMIIDSIRLKNDKQPDSLEKESINTLLAEAESLLEEIKQLKGDIFDEYEKKSKVLLSNTEALEIIERKDSIIDEANTLLEQAKKKAETLIKEAGNEASGIKNNAILSANAISNGLKESASVEAKKTIEAANALLVNANEDYQSSLASARQDAELIIAQARKTSEEILEKANASADTIIEGAHKSAQNILTQSNMEVEKNRKNIFKEHEDLAVKKVSLEATFAEEIRATKEELKNKKELLDSEILKVETEKQKLEITKNRYLKQIESEDEAIRRQAEELFSKMNEDLISSRDIYKAEYQSILKEYNKAKKQIVDYKSSFENIKLIDLKRENKILQDEIQQLKHKIKVINDSGIDELNAGAYKGAKEQFDLLLESNNSAQNENKKLKAQLAGMTNNDELVKALQRQNANLIEENEKFIQRLDAAKSRDEMLSPIRALPSFMVDNSNQLENDTFIDEIEWLDHIKKCAEDSGIILNDRMYYAYHTALKTGEWSPLVVLAGVSGTGKSELPRQYAVHGGMQFVSVPVKPDWDSPASLFGYYNSIENKLEATDLLKALYHMQVDANFNNQLMIVLLDEMNLAHPEQYFADMLSKFEGARGTKDGLTTIDIPLGAGEAPLSVRIGRNVLWTGTMNEDETTKGLSDKVVDRSNIITFPQPKELYDRKNCLIKEPEMVLTFKRWNEWKRNALKIDDPVIVNYMDNYRSCIERINGELNHLGRSLGQRVWQSIQYYIVNYPSVIAAVQNNKQQGKIDNSIKYAFCDAIAFKVMPKLRGLEVRGNNEKHINGIREILKEYTTVKFVDDYDKAINLTSELFQWCSSDFMNEVED